MSDRYSNLGPYFIGRRANTKLAHPPTKLRQLATIILLPVGFDDLHMYVDPDSGQSFRISFWPPFLTSRTGIFKQSMGSRNRVGIGLSYWLARLLRLAEFTPSNRFLGSLKN